MQEAAAGLPSKEQKNFKLLLKHYETKQYKKGLKLGEKMLEVAPQHAETKCLYGLFKFLLGEKEEGMKLAKEALGKNFKSQICWHVYGVIQRNNKNYPEAIKCYTQALKLDSENLNILRDMALLQIQIRDLNGYVDTRRKLLLNKTSLPINWITFAVAHHLNGDIPEALNVLSSHNKIISDDIKPYEKSELYTYEAMLYFESQDWQKLVEFLDKNSNIITDKLMTKEYYCKAYINLKNKEKATEYVKQLLASNNENSLYYDLYREIQEISSNGTEETNQKMVEFFDQLEKEHPNASNIKRTRLIYVSNQDFVKRIDQYIRPYFIKGLPAIFSELKGVLNTKERQTAFENLLLAHMKSLTEKGTFDGDTEQQFPCPLLWCYMVLAQLQDHMGKYDSALEHVEKGIKHTPTLIELYLIKAKILKHKGDLKGAAETADKARSLDLADRYLNNKAVKYLIRNDEIEKAEHMFKNFLRESNDENIVDLQVSWYEIEKGLYYLRKKEWGTGLKQFKFIEKHFQDMYDDQFDFHTYCMRKYQLRSYVGMLRQQDRVYQNNLFAKASQIMINGLMQYAEELPKIKQAEEEEKKNVEDMDKEARKKLKKEKELKDKARNDTEPHKTKIDYWGEKFLAEMKDPYQEASNFAKIAITLKVESEKLRTPLFTAISHLYLKKRKPLLVLKAFKHLEGKIKESEEVKKIAVEALKLIDEHIGKEDTAPEVKTLLENAKQQLRAKL
eukprot:CAMPEP_0176430588 /NCGR_PEP_ID=MMETSP0127-20121128/14336_1 /TAXON_ID=938130 /ORGANISM="Platyophrya macrostoma, Strain WH" /LENGTH=730 /DNA_ID=CAMNT_0017812493 /DNA_START=26 /DNA_END=2218 /DNA_ORIENTATION=-